MKLKPRRIAGAILTFGPMATIIVLIMRDVGIVQFLIGLGVCAVALATVFLGMKLLWD